MKKILLSFSALLLTTAYLIAQDTTLSIFNPDVDIIAFEEFLQNELDSLDEEDTLESEGELKQMLHFVNFWKTRIDTPGTPASGMQKMKNALPSLNCTNSGNWEPLGPLANPYDPNNSDMEKEGYMGIVDAVLAWESGGNLDVILAGSGSGGIFRSTDEGQNWVNVTDYMSTYGLGITCLEKSPHNSNHVIAGTGFTSKGRLYNSGWSNGYLKSSDKGLTWTDHTFGVISSGFGSGYVEAFVFDHTTVNRVFAAVDHHLLLSTDNGFTWSKIWNTGNSGIRLMDLKQDPSNANLLYGTTHGALGTKVYRILLSGTGSVTSTSVITPSSLLGTVDRVEIEFCADKPNHVYSLYHLTSGSLKILKQQTDVNGTTATYVHSTTFINSGGNSKFIMEFAISPTDETEVYTGGIQLYRKIGLDKFKCNFLHFDVRDIKIIKASTATSNDDAIILCGNDGGVSLSKNSGGRRFWPVGWTSINGKGLNITQIFHAQSIYHNGDILYTSHDNGTFRKQADNDKWENIGDGDGQILQVSANEENVFISQSDQLAEWNSKTGVSSKFGTVLGGVGEDAALVFDPSDNDIVYHTDASNNVKKLIWKYVTTSTLEINSSLLSGSSNSHIADMVISKKNTDIMYLAIEKQTLGGAASNIIYRYNLSTKVLTDITNGLGAVKWNFVTDIEVDPNDENKIWITFGNWSANERVFQGTYASGTMTWTNITFNLPAMPINKILLDDDNDRLLLATDAGVYVKSKSVSANSWICFSKNLPKVIVNDLYIDECRNKLIASTYGRGLWMGELADPVHDEWNIVGTVNITEDQFFKGDIIVKPGATLNIGSSSNSVTLMMGKGKKIIVENSAELYIENSTVTNNCGTRWEGIQVWGNSSINQDQQDPSFSRPFHGKVELLNATISNATNAITNWRPNKWYSMGGIIEARTSNFINNQRSMEFMKFRNVNVATQKIYADRSVILGCTFENNSDYFRSGSDPYKPMITMWDVHELNVANCTFKNTAYATLNPNKRGTAILEHDASSVISGNTFDHMSKGVVSGQVTSLYGTNLTIRNNTFTETWIGTITKAHDISITINNNQFNGGVTYNSWIETSTGVEITENTYGSGSIGIITADLGAHGAEVYNNDFEDHDIGIYTSGKTGKSNQGLTYKCNDFINNLDMGDIHIYNGLIHPRQGECKTGPNAAATPAGNQFSHTCNASEDDYNLYTGYPSKMLYSHHNVTSGARFKPNCYTTQKINAKQCIIGYSSTASCPTRITTVGTGSGGFSGKLGIAIDGYSDSKVAKTDAVAVWNNTIDGGNTSSRVSYVNDALNSSAEVKTELDNYWPYLSDAVLQACIDRNPALAATDLNYLLQRSSPLSIAIADQLPNLDHILSSTQIEDLIDLQGGISLRDSIELDTVYHQNQAELYLNEIVRLFAFDTSGRNPNPLDSMVFYLEDYDAYHPFAAQTKNMLVKAYWQQGNYTKAQQAIDELDTDPEYQGLATVLQKLNDMLSYGDSLPVLFGDTVLFDSLATDSTQFGYGMARNLLSLIHSRVRDRYIEEIPGDASRSEETVTAETIEGTKNRDFVVYPNPNSGQFELVWNNSSNSNGFGYQIIDMQGRIILEGNSIVDSGSLTIQIPNKTNGIYKLQVFNGKQMIHQKNIVVSE